MTDWRPGGEDPLDAASAGDGVLQWLAYSVERAGGSIDLTLLVGGTLVTGTLIPAREYFSRAGDLFAREARQMTGRDDVAGEVDRSWTAAGDRVPVPDASDPEAVAAYVGQVGHLHLERAHFFANGRLEPALGVLLRLRVEAVSGFFFQRLGPKPEAQPAGAVPTRKS